MARMQDSLAAAQAPRRQLDGVRAWRADIEAVMAVARPSEDTPGISIDDAHRLTRRGWSRPSEAKFLHGDPTHKAWLKLCQAIISALDAQGAHAAERCDLWLAHAAQAKTRKARAVALRRANQAAL